MNRMCMLNDDIDSNEIEVFVSAEIRFPVFELKKKQNINGINNKIYA